jgi:hypothetical protein
MTEQRSPRLAEPNAVHVALAPTPGASPAQSRPNGDAAVGGGSALQVGHARAKLCPHCAERYPADFRVCPRDATELQDAPEQDEDPMLGIVLANSYELLRLIGEGGMGRVYEARHTRLGNRRLAIKLLHADMARQPEVVSRFLREAEATSVLSHDNIVSVLDVNRAPDGRPYIVAELLQGEQLGDYLERVGKLKVQEAVWICRQICRALVAAHAEHIVHRDIKPENVFLVGRGEERTVKVLDFGISRVGESGANLTKTGMVMGTPAYMPPEQARGQRVDHRADVYAVGALLYEAVTGRQPFEGLDPVATLASVLSQEPARPRTLDDTLPLALEMLIQKAMAKEPDERYASMSELDHALAAFDSSPEIATGSGALPAPLMASAADSGRTSGWLGALPGEAPLPERARTRIVVLSLVGCLGLIVAATDAALSMIRWIRASGTLTSTESVLAGLGALGLLSAPALAWARYVHERVWPNTARAVDVLGRMQRVLVASLVSYGAVALLVRVLDGVLRADASKPSWAGWPVLSFYCALVTGVLTWFWERLRRAV